MKQIKPGQRPTESVFYGPVIYLIGRLTGFKPYVGVPHEKIREDVMRLAGLDLVFEEDPENPGKQVPVGARDPHGYYWPLRDTSTKVRDGLYRVVSFGWYHQTRQYRSVDEALCAKAVYPEIEHLENVKYDLLELTEEEEEIMTDAQVVTKLRKDIRDRMTGVQADLSERQEQELRELRGEILELQVQERQGTFSSKKEKALHEARDAYYNLLGVTDEEREILHDPTWLKRRKDEIRAKMKRNTKLLDEEQKALLKDAEEALKDLKAKCRGEWALTALGAQRAQELREVYEGKIRLSCGPNRTARHLGDNWDRYAKRIRQHLNRKMPRSAEFDKVEDHMMNWIVRVISRDGLRKRLEEGKTVPPSHAQGWARKSAYTDIRNEGREPVCRTFNGALTKKEIPLYDHSSWTTTHIPRTINESDILHVNSYAEHGEDDFVGDTIDNLRDDTPTGNVEGSVLASDAFEGVLDRMSEVLVEDLGEEIDVSWYRQIVLDRFVKEMTIREIAESRGLKGDDRKVSAALNRVRDCMMQARDFGELDEFMAR